MQQTTRIKLTSDYRPRYARGEIQDIAIQKTKFRGFQLFYENEDATFSMCREIEEFPSLVSDERTRPLIIDCGANIGVSVLEWKTRWPQSEVICFEPDPFAFELLIQNIDKNDVPAVTCHNAAVSDHEGIARLHGQIRRGGDARGNSLDPSWGRRPGSDAVDVQCVRLADVIQGRCISFLKLDVEGTEERVLRGIKDQLPQIDAIYVEVHETDATIDVNSVDRIEELLRHAGFSVDRESRYAEHALPSHLDAWRQRVNARQHQLVCWRQ